MCYILLKSLVPLATLYSSAVNAALVSRPGQSSIVPAWEVQSSSVVDYGRTAAWYTIGSKGTLMATLLENNVFNETTLFHSNNLEDVPHAPFAVPWYYRSEFELSSSENHTHFLLKTHGISSRADIYFNEALIADKDFQAGAYAGFTYDVTSKVKTGKNVLLVRVYPTDYNRDFALGFVDWNPYPPDNGTGMWRDVEIKQTEKLSFLGTPRVNTKLDGRVRLIVDVMNLAADRVRGCVVCSVVDPRGKNQRVLKKDIELAAKETQKVSLDYTILNPEIWWPKQWGAQPLYTASCTVATGSHLSDATAKVRFGIRTVTSSLNQYNDTTFFINGQPFQVCGAGYTSDIFLRFDEAKLRTQFQYVLDMGLNTVRLEGKQEHPRFYELADELGIMLMAGWECCDKWEGWTYNDEGSGEKWQNSDYAIANNSMRHEAERMQHHPSLLAFLVGSDFWPDDRAVRIYADALHAFDWDVPIIASASQRGYPSLLGNGGMKMDGPYDWVPPNYWYTDQLGAAFGFGSELGAGVGTPELNSLRRFLSPSDLSDLWKAPTKGLYHMSTSVSSFYTRTIYNNALWARYGAPTSLENYLLKAQLMDYEATRAEFEAYAVKWGAERPATGLIYWMLNNAWPSLHWNLFDYYLHPGGSYFGTKAGSRPMHVAYDYVSQSVYLINRSLAPSGPLAVEAELLNLKGEKISRVETAAQSPPNNRTKLFKIQDVDKIDGVALLKLVLFRGKEVLSRNVYHLTPRVDALDFDNSTWYHTPVTRYADFTALNDLPQANLSVEVSGTKIVLTNKSKVPAVFVRLNLADGEGADVVPVTWSDNYVTLWPDEELKLEVRYADRGNVKVEVDGWNVGKQTIGIRR